MRDALVVATLGACSWQPQDVIRDLPSQRFVLANGMQVIVLEDPTAPVALLNTCVRASALDDPPGKTGLAHLVEHLAIRGYAREVSFDPGPITNGATNFNATCFTQKLPASRLERALARERERLESPLVVAKQRFEDERRSVLQEMHERFGIRAAFTKADDPERDREMVPSAPPTSWLMAARRSLWPELSRWDYLPVGRAMDVIALSPEDAQGFLAKWYMPSNTSLTIAGAVQPEQARVLAKKWLEDLPNRLQSERRTVTWADRLNPGRSRISADGAPSLSFGWRVPMGLEPDAVEIRLLARVLGDSEGGRVVSAFRAAGHPVLSAITLVESEAGIGALLVKVTLGPSTPHSVGEKVLNETIEQLRSQPIPRAEFETALALVEARLAYKMDSLSDRVERALSYQHELGHPNGWRYEAAQSRRSNGKSLRRVAEVHLSADRRAVLIDEGTGGSHQK